MMFLCWKWSHHGKNLLSAVERGDSRLAEQILEEDPVCAFYTTFRTRKHPLAVAAERGDLAMLQAIHAAAERSGVEAQLVMDCAGSQQRTPVMFACQNGHLDCLSFLMDHGANGMLYTWNTRHETALHVAAAAGHAACTSRLLQSTLINGANGRVALARAVYGEGTRYIDALNGNGLSALHLAAAHGNSDTALALIRAGANIMGLVAATRVRPVSSYMYPGSNALHVAAACGHSEVAGLLLDAQAANPGSADLRRVRNSHGLRPSHCARLAGHHDVGRLVHYSPAVFGRPRSGSRIRSISGLGGHSAADLDTLLGMLVARAKLLLSLRLADPRSRATDDKALNSMLAAVGRTASAPDMLQLLASVQGRTPRGQQFPFASASGVGLLANRPADSFQVTGVPTNANTFRYYAASVLVETAIEALTSAAVEGHRSSQSPLEATTSAGSLAGLPLQASVSSHEAVDTSEFSNHVPAGHVATRAPWSEAAGGAPGLVRSGRQLSGLLGRWRQRQRRRQRRDDHPTPDAAAAAAMESFSTAPYSRGSLSMVASTAVNPSAASVIARTARRDPFQESDSHADTVPSLESVHASSADGIPVVTGAPPTHVEAATGSSGARSVSWAAVAAAAAAAEASATRGALSSRSERCIRNGSISFEYGVSDGTRPAAVSVPTSHAEVGMERHITGTSVQLTRTANDDRTGCSGDAGECRPEDDCHCNSICGGELGDNTDAVTANGSVECENLCTICMDEDVRVSVAGCGHGLCLGCAYQLCSRGLAQPSCPFCRAPIANFDRQSNQVSA